MTTANFKIYKSCIPTPEEFSKLTAYLISYNSDITGISYAGAINDSVPWSSLFTLISTDLTTLTNKDITTENTLIKISRTGNYLITWDGLIEIITITGSNDVDIGISINGNNPSITAYTTTGLEGKTPLSSHRFYQKLTLNAGDTLAFRMRRSAGGNPPLVINLWSQNIHIYKL